MGMATADPQFHVLAVDDNLLDRKLIERILKISSCQVTTVDSGDKALEFLGLHDYEETNQNQTNQNQPSVSPNSHQEVEVNLIITDYCMPGMTGYDLLKRIKESSFLRDIPVVIMSSENVPSRINRCLEEGAEEFILKPVRISDVNKLKPHMMKSKSKDHHQKKPEETQEQASLVIPDDVQISLPLPQQEQQQHQTSNNNKRKAIDEALSPDRTRPRYSDITVASS